MPDLSLNQEEQNKLTIIARYLSNANITATTTPAASNPQITEVDASEYLPDGASLGCSFVSDGQILFIDYVLDNVRYIVSYHSDGLIKKSARALENNYIYSVDNESSTIQGREVRVETIVHDLTELDGSENSITQLSATSGITIVDPIPYTDHEPSLCFVAEIVRSGYVTISALADVGLSTLVSYNIYETMSSHKETLLETSDPYYPAESLTDIAQELLVTLINLESWLANAAVSYTTELVLVEPFMLVQEHGYSHWSGREIGFYDKTKWNTYVNVDETWGTGHITVVWQYDSFGYRNPTWGHDVLSPGLTGSWNELLDDACSAYTHNIEEYGYWKLGPLVFGA